ERLAAIRELRNAGIETFAALAPLLPCTPEILAGIALEATNGDVIGDPLHVRAVKPQGATTREAAAAISRMHDFSAWLEPVFQAETIQRIAKVVRAAGRRFGTGTEAFRWLTQ